MLKHIPFYASLLGRPLTDKIKATSSHVLVYGAIEAHSMGPKGCTAANALLASETGLSTSTVSARMSELAKAGWITVTLNKNNQRTKSEPNLEPLLPSKGGLLHSKALYKEEGTSKEDNPSESASAVSENPEEEQSSSVYFDGPSPQPTAATPSVGSPGGDLTEVAEDVITVKKLYYDVVKKYNLPKYNNTVLQGKMKDLESEVGYETAVGYLRALLVYDWHTIEGDYKPVIGNALDIYGKRVKILEFLKKNVTQQSQITPENDPYSDEAWAAAEERREQAKKEAFGDGTE